ncbi:MAG: DUF1599 domain-containing protein [Bacteroidales bacterium]|nr:DUF1599 domain-containing protein [Bacteroidales bacterium]
MANTHNTNEEYNSVIAECRTLFSKKLQDYGCAWRILRAASVTDQIFIKAKRIRTLEIETEAMVQEGIKPELIGIVNYAIIALIQLELGATDHCDLTVGEAVGYYDNYAQKAFKLLQAKNHDYGEAWREMRPESYTDLILQKIIRTKQIEDNNGQTIVSEGIDANYFDMLNYAVFYIIRLSEQ